MTTHSSPSTPSCHFSEHASLFTVLIPHRFAFPFINRLTHFSGNWSAFFLSRHLALRHPLGDALRGLDVLVLGLIHGGVLVPALNLMMAAAMVRFARSSGS